MTEFSRDVIEAAVRQREVQDSNGGSLASQPYQGHDRLPDAVVVGGGGPLSQLAPTGLLVACNRAVA